MAVVAFLLLVLLNSVFLAKGRTDPECANYDHSQYGCVGKCISTASCPGRKYKSNLCPTQGNDIKCCFTADTDKKCAEYNRFLYGQVGQCISTSQCPGNAYTSNLCPTKPGGVKCCFRKPEGTCPAPSGTCTLSQKAQSLACAIQSNKKITLLDNNKYLNSKGANDGADAKSNIQDTCNGKAAKRSSYCCSSGCAPGESVCLSSNALQYLLDLANAGYSIQVNAITGACHSSRSRHYRGTAVDLQVFGNSPYSAWMKKCKDMGAVESLGPGDRGHKTHTHCAFNN